MMTTDDVIALNLSSSLFDPIYEMRDGIPHFKNYINGKWVMFEQFQDLHSPIDGELLGRTTQPSEEAAIACLDEVYARGKANNLNFSGQQRLNTFLKAAELIKEHREQFIDTLVKTSAKPVSNATGEVDATIERLEKTSGEYTFLRGDFIPGDWSKETYQSHGIVKRVPFGIIVTIGPFNYPLFIPSSKIIPSILTGNAVILKPASVNPVAALMLTRVLEVAGLPEGVLNTMTIAGRDSAAILKSRKVNAISFTGSTQTGERIMKTAGIKNYHMELGGKDPAIVLKDADLDLAADKIVQGMVKYAGQRCDGVKLILAQQPIYKELKSRLLSNLDTIRALNPLEHPEAIMGPLIEASAADTIEEVYEDAMKKGATALTEFHRNGLYIDPVLLELDGEKLHDFQLAEEEIFGPLAVLMSFDTATEAIELANSTRFGLDAAIFGGDDAVIHRLSNRLDFGAVFVNEYPRHGIGYYPFGGVKDSGIGREGIGYSVNQMTTTKTIVTNYSGNGVWEEL